MLHYRLRAELAHTAENRHTLPCVSDTLQQLQRRAHRSGVGIVCIVNKHGLAKWHPHTAHTWHRHCRHPCGGISHGHTTRTRRCQREHRICCLVRTTQRQRDVYTFHVQPWSTFSVEPPRTWHHVGVRQSGSHHCASATNGRSPLDQPEARALHDLVLAERPHLVIVAHAWRDDHFINYDGPAERHAQLFSQRSGYRVKPSDKIAPTPGSLGSWIGRLLGIPILTLEYERGADPRSLWLDTRDAILAVILSE